MDLSMLKPFNPILGETFQCSIGPYKFVAEQISHHPPISAFQLWDEEDPNIEISGHYEFVAQTSPNQIKAQKVGPLIIHFNDDQSDIIINQNQMVGTGTMFGQRHINLAKKVTI